MEDYRGKHFVASYSGGKDSVLAIYRAILKGMVPDAFIITYNTDLGRSWFHGIPMDVLREVEQAAGVSVRLIRTGGADYAANFEQMLREYKALGADICVFGDIDIEGHLEWGRARCAAAGMEAYYPLWQEKRADLVKECIESGFTARITVVDIKRLSPGFLGRQLTHEVMREIEAAGADVCGENGEYHTFVTDGPIFSKPLPVEFAPPVVPNGYAVLPVLLKSRKPVLTNGYVQVYTGDGKGKTTASMGLILRAMGAGMNVYFGQFMKTGETSEIRAMRTFGDAITIEQYGDGNELYRPDPEADQAAARAGFIKARQALNSGRYDMVVLDEIHVAAFKGYLTEEEILQLMEEKPYFTELILTGRYAAKSVMEKADLVTGMTEIRHYYKNGVGARRGIEM